MTQQQVELVARKHGFLGDVRLRQHQGIVNDIWDLGCEAILRVPKEQEFAEDYDFEAQIQHFVSALGLKVPKVLHYEPPSEEGAFPYMIIETKSGDSLGSLPYDENIYVAVLDAIGEQLAQLHRMSLPENWISRAQSRWWADDPAEELDKVSLSQNLTSEEIRWCETFILRLLKAFDRHPTSHSQSTILVHHDLHPWNVLIEDMRLQAVIDWGNACCGDPAVDFSGFPLWAIPQLLKSYKQMGGQIDETIYGRILWFWFGTALVEPDWAQPTKWGRMPLGGIKEMRFRLPLLPEQFRPWIV